MLIQIPLRSTDASPPRCRHLDGPHAFERSLQNAAGQQQPPALLCRYSEQQALIRLAVCPGRQGAEGCEGRDCAGTGWQADRRHPGHAGQGKRLVLLYSCMRVFKISLGSWHTWMNATQSSKRIRPPTHTVAGGQRQPRLEAGRHQHQDRKVLAELRRQDADQRDLARVQSGLPVRGHTTLTKTRHDGPNHLGLCALQVRADRDKRLRQDQPDQLARAAGGPDPGTRRHVPPAQGGHPDRPLCDRVADRPRAGAARAP